MWSRTSNSSIGRNWLTLGVFTLLLAVMILPESGNQQDVKVMVAAKIEDMNSKNHELALILKELYQNSLLLDSVKHILKGCLVFAYVTYLLYILYK
jgi:hypothetical protein